MSALYVMNYLGSTGVGIGAIYVGKGTIVGADAGGGRYSGTYVEANGRLKGTFYLSMPNGGQLVTGQQVPPGTKLPISADWPSNFANGQPQQVVVSGNPVQVTLEKVGDIP
ncbi:MAG: hypothetical protein ACYC1L_00710 [Alphaproteobacteria bacterium]